LNAPKRRVGARQKQATRNAADTGMARKPVSIRGFIVTCPSCDDTGPFNA